MKRGRTQGRLLTFVAAALAIVAMSLASGCFAPGIHAEVVELRVLHAQYRSATVPRSDLDAKKVEALEESLDATMASLEELTR